MGIRDNRFLSLLFFLNTLGAFAGALVSGFLILPLLGQQNGLLIAISMNAIASLLAVLLSREVKHSPRSAEISESISDQAAGGHSLRPALVLGFSLGLCSLAYEMHLFRIGALINQPLPWRFSLVLAVFLLTWSLGVYAAGKLPNRVDWWLFLTALSVGITPVIYSVARWKLSEGPWMLPFRIGLFGVCFVPCFFFGVLFTQIIARFARSWGQDVGYYFAANTFGSCLGVVLGTLVGFEFAPEAIPWTIFAVLILLLAGHRMWSHDARSQAKSDPQSQSRFVPLAKRRPPKAFPK